MVGWSGGGGGTVWILLNKELQLFKEASYQYLPFKSCMYVVYNVFVGLCESLKAVSDQSWLQLVTFCPPSHCFSHTESSSTSLEIRNHLLYKLPSYFMFHLVLQLPFVTRSVFLNNIFCPLVEHVPLHSDISSIFFIRMVESIYALKKKKSDSVIFDSL